MQHHESLPLTACMNALAACMNGCMNIDRLHERVDRLHEGVISLHEGIVSLHEHATTGLWQWTTAAMALLQWLDPVQCVMHIFLM